ncbi:sensor histidine kinase [Paenibacillus nasutitermitis]|uniref:histidine kinase n=1 Tax=Paenibacillus nasutitermitis TaxID=1652958 RepID=A0A916YS55_9BACL|nr:histidine kinase [Paenibacillus nasutitermitis]GGD58976.1 histidine kinase [Paenibacillus nasutitermitis]
MIRLIRTDTNISLRRRLFSVLMLIVFIPLVLLGGISYVAIQEIYSNKIESGITNTLVNVKSGLESTLENMEYASLQLSMEGSVGQNFYDLLANPSNFQKYALQKEIQKNLNLVNFTNPYLGVILYYDDKGKVMFNNLEVREGFMKENGISTLLSKVNGVTFYGPRKTAYRYGDYDVFSLVRPVESPGALNESSTNYVYMETNVKQFEKLLSKQQYGMKVSHVLLDQAGQIVFTDLNKEFPKGKKLQQQQQLLKMGVSLKTDDYYLYKVTSEQGWSLIVTIHKGEFNKEFNNWLYKFFAVLLGGIAISITFATVIWKSVYGPLKKIGHDIGQVDPLQSNKPMSLTRIIEFDVLVKKMNQLRERIQFLFIEVENRERAKRQLEVEALLYQINPHFIHNTLNSIQFMARMNGQEDIDRMVSIFTRVLHYNLDKRGETVELKEELAALKDYIELQQIRYDYEFGVKFQMDEDIAASTIRIPKFILQPLVENALYHGIDTNQGVIEVKIAKDNNTMIIHITDNGRGMTAEEIERLLADENQKNRKTGLGIGLNYVRRMLEAHYENRYTFEITSTVGHGTLVTLRIPLSLEF